MRTKLSAILLTIALMITLWGCSSPPKLTQSPAKMAADNTLKLAHNLEQKQQLRDAWITYQSAYDQYSNFASFKGKLYALAGLARIAYLTDDAALLSEKQRMMKEIVQDGEPDAAYIPQLVELYILQDQKDYQGVRDSALDSYDYPIDARMQILSYQLQAEAYLNPGYKSVGYEDLLRLSKRYKRSLKSDFSADPSVLSGALYALAYQSYGVGDLRQAERDLQSAIELDYLYENFPSLGYGYWLKGKIFEKEGDDTRALANFLRAKSIFESLGMKEMTDRASADITRIKGIKQ